MKRFSILMTAVLLAGCSQQAPEDAARMQAERRHESPSVPRGALIGTAGYDRIYVFHDNENGNTCYSNERGISCVPMAYRNLHQESSDAVSYR